MARRTPRPAADQHHILEPQYDRCVGCGRPLWMAYHNYRTIQRLDGLHHLTLKIRRCRNAACPLYRRPSRPEEEGAWALPHGEFGLDVIALVGTLRFAEHRTIPEIHRLLDERQVHLAQRTVTHLVERYEELVALHLADQTRLQHQLRAQQQVVLAIDGLQPDVGHEVLWVIRDCLSGAVLLARSLLSSTEADLATLLREVTQQLPVPVRGVISDGQQPIRKAVRQVLPEVPHQLCQFHYLREAAKPIFEADRHAKKELKKQVRGVRPIERAVEERMDAAAAVVRGYCLAVRSALTDDGRPPLCAAGLKLQERLQAITTSIQRVAEKGGARRSYSACSDCWSAALPPLQRPGQRSAGLMAGSTTPRSCWTITRSDRRQWSRPPMRRCSRRCAPDGTRWAPLRWRSTTS